MVHQSVENLILGCGLSGATTKWILHQQGYENGVVLEKNSHPFGANGSFQDDLGNRFDYGRHILDANRSGFTARFFRKSQDGAVRRFTLRRGIVVENHLIPYAAPLREWPQPLRKKIDVDSDSEVVRPGSSREDFARAYGDWFAERVFEDMIRAIPVLQCQKEQGRPEEELLRWIYPWFFPLSDREAPPDPEREKGIWSPESRRYHHRVRHGDQAEEALYPTQNGYANWIQSLVDSSENIPLRTDRESLDIERSEGTAVVESVQTSDERYSPDRVFWCAPAGVLASLLGIEPPSSRRQTGVLGSFAFEETINTDYHEILFADPRHRIKRVSVREYLEGKSESRTLQVEFLYPQGDFGRDAQSWKNDWLSSLRELGITDPGNSVRGFDFKRVPRGWVPNPSIKKFVDRVRNRVDQSPSNIVFPHLEAGPGNSSRSIPSVFRNVYASLSRD